MRSKEFIRRLIDVAQNQKTKYMWGAIGGPINATYIANRAAQWPAYYTASYRQMLTNVADKGWWGFDCVGLIKGILWGWSADPNHWYGGAQYLSNGVPDVGADYLQSTLIKNRSSDFSKIQPGDAVFFPGHVGVFVGDGKVVEATTNFGGGVVISNLAGRGWKTYGQLPWVDYSDRIPGSSTSTAATLSYVVQPGDYPILIATRELKDWSLYKAIEQLNGLTGQYVLRPGQVLKLPSTGTATATPTVPAIPFELLICSRGDEGKLVMALQMAINAQIDAGLAPDGSFGDKTHSAVRKYQDSKGLTIDGIAGATTWQVLLGGKS